MDSGNFTPIVHAAVLDPDDHSVVQYLDLVFYRINGIDIDIEFYDPSGSFSNSVSLERGAKIGNTEYTIFSGIYKLTRSFKAQGGNKGLYVCSGSLIEPTTIDIPAGDGTYHQCIRFSARLWNQRSHIQNARQPPGSATSSFQMDRDLSAVIFILSSPTSGRSIVSMPQRMA